MSDRVRVAEPQKVSVTPAHAPMLARKCGCSDRPGERCKCNDDEKPRAMQRKASRGDAAPASIPTSVRNVLNAPGSPLDGSTRTYMESRFGHDFSAVRVHTGGDASESAEAVGAHAYTVGNDIVFGSGKYDPQSESGRHLLAHELTHTIQQRGLQKSALDSLAESTPGDRYESEADSIASHVIHSSGGGAPLSIHGSPIPFLGRQGPERQYDRRLNRTRQPRRFQFTILAMEDGPGPRRAGNVPSSAAFRIDAFPLPREKGDVISVWREKAAAGALETTVSALGRNPTTLWQSRAVPDDLRSNWLLKVGWQPNCAPHLWQSIGGNPRAPAAAPGAAVPAPGAAPATAPAPTAAHFPLVVADTCALDHVVELQLSGTNVPANMSMLDGPDNTTAGREIRFELAALVGVILDEIWPEPSARPDNITLHFDTVRQVATPNRCANVNRAQLLTRVPMCWELECVARSMTDADRAAGCAAAGVTTAPPSAVPPYVIQAAGNRANVIVPARTGTNQPVDFESRQPAPPGTAPGTPPPPAAGPAENLAASELIPGMLLTRLNYLRTGAGRPDTIDAEWDDRQFSGGVDRRARTRRPTTLRGAQQSILFNVDANDGNRLRLRNPGSRLAFVYPYLSDGFLTITQDASGELTGRGQIQPSVPLLRRFPINVTWARNELNANVQIPKERLQPPIPGFRVTDATLGIELSPAFRPYGTVSFAVGPRTRPIIDATVTAEADANGLVLTGDAHAHIPGIDNAQGHIEYRNGEWSGFILIESTQLRIPRVQRGQIRADFNSRGYTVGGGVTIELPGANNTAELSVQKRGDRWIYTGRGTFDPPGLRPVTLDVTYDGEHLRATGRTGFTIASLNGNIELTYDDGRFSGRGTVDINRGRAQGSIEVVLSNAGRFSGRGNIRYQINPNLIASAGIELREDRTVRLTGALEFPQPIRLFTGIDRERELFNRSVDIPIVGVSLGPVSVGLIARITGAFGVSYGIGPGELRQVRIAAAFNPLEENPELDLQLGARLVIPAHAGLFLSIRGGIGLSAGIASVTGGITARGDAELRGGLEAAVDVRYQRNRFSVDAFAEISATPRLRFTLSADVTAEAGAFGLSYREQKVWRLASFEYGSNLRFGLRAPIHYASDEEFHAPTADDIQWIVPEIDPMQAVRDMIDRASA